MDKNELKEQLERNPVVVAIGDIKELDNAIKSPSEIVFILVGDIFNIEKIVKNLKDVNKRVFIHVDLIRGLSNDEIGLRYISEEIKPTGIISTKSSLIKQAKHLGLNTVQRVFVLDSKSLEGGINSVKLTNPDAVEIMPGIMPEITKKVSQSLNIPVITGGLIDNKDEVIESLKYGATSISTSCNKIWFI